MGRQIWKPGNMLYPLPAVLVSVADRQGNTNLFTVAWTGTVCSDPPMVSVSVRPERYSYHMIEETGEFVVNLTTEALAYATDYCGVKSGREVDKWREMKLTPIRGAHVLAPMVAESPVNLECRVTRKLALGTHHMFLAEVLAVHADESYMDANGSFRLNDAKPLVYSHGRYLGIGKELGTFGYSVKSRPKGKGKTDAAFKTGSVRPGKKRQEKDSKHRQNSKSRKDSENSKESNSRNGSEGSKERKSSKSKKGSKESKGRTNTGKRTTGKRHG